MLLPPAPTTVTAPLVDLVTAADAPQGGAGAAPRGDDAVTVRSTWRPEGREGLRYEAQARTVLVHDDDGSPLAEVFCVAYTACEAADPAARPITFVLQGAPGESGPWLNVGGFGPRGVHGGACRPRAAEVRPAPGPPGHAAHAVDLVTAPASAEPRRLVDAPHSLLPSTDLVFVDAVGSGFSRRCPQVPLARVHGVDQDVDVFARLTHRFLDLTGAWARPRFVLGAGYGATRALALARHLQEHDVDVAGVVALRPRPDRADPADDLYHVHRLPTYAGTAWHHGLGPHHDLGTVLQEARDFAMGDFATTLHRGDRATPAERRAVAERTAELTGLPVDLLLREHLRVDAHDFVRTLRSADGLVLNLADTRTTAPDPLHLNGLSALRDHVARELGHRPTRPYRSGPHAIEADTWDWRRRGTGHRAAGAPARTGHDLAAVLRGGTGTQVALVGGIYDLTSPFFGVESDLARSYLDETSREVVHLHWYGSGGLPCADPETSAVLADDLAEFYLRATGG